MSLSDIIRNAPIKLRKSAGVRVSPAVHRLITRGDRARDARRWPEAAEAYQAALSLDPSLAHIWIQLGHAHKERGADTDAEAAYRKAAALQPGSAEPYLHIGHLEKDRGALGEAGRCYLRAVQSDPSHADALGELIDLAAKGQPISPDVLVAMAGEDANADEAPTSQVSEALRLARASVAGLLSLLPSETGRAAQSDVSPLISELDLIDERLRAKCGSGDIGPALVFDVSDLISYFRNARLPTGIQRVQIETIVAALTGDMDQPILLCAFAEHRDEWIEIPSGRFLSLCRLSLASGERTDPAWIRALAGLQLRISTGAALEFPRRSWLINLGTSWWLQNYFLLVRNAKRTHDIRYVPFVHDFIPVMAPEHCIKELTQDFISWAIGVFDHADHFLVNSEATKRDLLAVASFLDRPVADQDVVVVRLDGDIRKAGVAPLSRSALGRWGLAENEFVLFVSTIESRKNHLGAFDAWTSLMRRLGPRRTPKLVCVGNRGWLNDAVYARLEEDEALRSRVVMLQGLSDPELDLLYRSCLFTLYPSRYEGWGLPVTESLCYGKTPLCSDATSLPEAGGPFAVYFEAESSTRMAVAAARLITDAEHRTALERRIIAEFRPRPWRDIAGVIAQATADWDARGDNRARQAPGWRGAEGRLGAYHPIVRNFERRLRPRMRSGEVFRVGDGWSWPDDWGCWTKACGGELHVTLPETSGALRLYLQLHGLPQTPSTYAVELPSGHRPSQGLIAPQGFKWIAFDIAEPPADRMITVRVRGDATEDLGNVTQGGDRRVVSIGVCGFFLCPRDDAAMRADFLEAVALGNLADLSLNRPRHEDEARPYPGS